MEEYFLNIHKLFVTVIQNEHFYYFLRCKTYSSHHPIIQPPYFQCHNIDNKEGEWFDALVFTLLQFKFTLNLKDLIKISMCIVYTPMEHNRAECLQTNKA